jgi:hypothetical protein
MLQWAGVKPLAKLCPLISSDYEVRFQPFCGFANLIINDIFTLHRHK